MSFLKRHATGATLLFFILAVVGLSAAPVPEWLRPLDDFAKEDPFGAFLASVFTRPESVPRPSQGYVAGGGAEAIAEEDQYVDYDSESDPDEDQVELAPHHDRVEVGGRTPTAQGLGLDDQASTATAGAARPSKWTPPERKAYDFWAKRLGLRVPPIVRPCRTPAGPGPCRERALDHFFSRLSDAELGRGEPVRIVHYGDSLIASDKISDMVRRRLQERFGSGGKGFLMIKKFNSFQRGYRTGDGSGGWRLDVITQRVLRDRYFGYSGASFTAQNAGEETTFRRLGRSQVAEVYYLKDRKGGRLEVLADKTVLGEINTRTNAATSEAMKARFTIPPGTTEFKLRAVDYGPRLFGVVLEADQPGVVYESIGLPGATSRVWNEPDREDFERQLGLRDPALVIVMLGGNDGLMLSKERTTTERIEADLDAFVGRIQEASAKTDCLLVSPLEAVRKKGSQFIPKPEVLEVIELERRVAERRGCAFWDMHAAMGGEGSLAKWVKSDLMLPDLIHPRNRGSNLLGEMMSEAIMDAYDEHRARAGEGS
ncbi:MAG: hypothetical protein IPK13_27115 [Deltaproteobacteria bacterium]|nr:hypothetical protein [Deltaproteobacteria bacterium]